MKGMEFWYLLTAVSAILTVGSVLRVGFWGQRARAFAAAGGRGNRTRDTHVGAIKLAGCMMIVTVACIEFLVNSASLRPVDRSLLVFHWIMVAAFAILVLATLLWFNGDKQPNRHAGFAYTTIAAFLAVAVTGGMLLYQAWP